jgi:prepilin-type N-terminal cleavage/methylation domain-containing protein
MQFVSLQNNTDRETRGFTLIELMVAVSIFSIVLMMALGTVLTIMDANRKARTLTEVMNNLNFSLETMTRSLKTGVEPGVTSDANGAILSVVAIILEEDVEGDRFRREVIEYQCRDCEDDARGYIAQRSCAAAEGVYACSGGSWIPITSDQVDITNMTFSVYGGEDNQPRTQLSIEGDVRINDKISSSFSLQTTVSQRKLNLEGNETGL